MGTSPSLCSQYVPRSHHLGRIAVEHYSAQKLHSFVIALLQILDLLFAGSQVATISVTSHTYYIY